MTNVSFPRNCPRCVMPIVYFLLYLHSRGVKSSTTMGLVHGIDLTRAALERALRMAEDRGLIFRVRKNGITLIAATRDAHKLAASMVEQGKTKEVRYTLSRKV